MNFKLFTLSKKKLLILIFLFFYIKEVVSSILCIREITTVIILLKDYLDSIPTKTSPYISIEDLVQRSSSYYPKLNKVLGYYPIIQKYESYYVSPMAYGLENIENYNSAIEHYNNLLMKRNYLIHDLKDSINPLKTLENIFSFPSTFLDWIGFTPHDSLAKLLNAFTWLITLLFSMYSDEIKTVVNFLIQHLFHA